MLQVEREALAGDSLTPGNNFAANFAINAWIYSQYRKLPYYMRLHGCFPRTRAADVSRHSRI
jgi:hypothetical protein